MITPGKEPAKLTLRIDAKYAAHVHGVILDRDGMPVAAATVSLSWGRNYVSGKTRFSGVSSTFEAYKTDAGGKFASSGCGRAIGTR